MDGASAQLGVTGCGTRPAGNGRLYGGLSTDERDRQRRESVLAAGVELFGTKGYALTSMTEVAEHAQVAFRYVARLFADKEALLEAVFVRVQDHVLAEVEQAPVPVSASLSARIRAGLTAAITAYFSDPRRVRISFLDGVGVSQHLEEVRRQTSRRFVDQLVHGLESAAQAGEALPCDYAMLSVGLVGAVGAILADWAARPAAARPALGEVAETACRLYLRTLGLPEHTP